MKRNLIVLLLLGVVARTYAGAVLEVVPQQAGPYEAGQTVGLEVRLHNDESIDIDLRYLALDIRRLRETLFVGGDFLTAGGVTARGLARLDGDEWRPIPTPSVYSLSVDAMMAFPDQTSSELLVGAYYMPGKIRIWDGFSWSAPSPIPSVTRVSKLFRFDDGTGPAPYMAGYFVNVDGVLRDITKWNGQNWELFPSVYVGVFAATMFDDGGGPDLYIGGGFVYADDGSGVTSCWSVARLENGGWQPLGGGVMGGSGGNAVTGLVVFDEGSGDRLFAAGNFYNAVNAPPPVYLPVHKIARWDGTTWSDVAGGINPGAPGEIKDMVVFDDGSGPAIYVGGRFTVAGTTPVNNIARWDGSSWTDVGGGVTGGDAPVIEEFLIANEECGPVLYASGKFEVAGGAAASGVARWDGTSWAAVGNGIGGGVAKTMALALGEVENQPGLQYSGNFQFDFSTLALGGAAYLILPEFPYPTIVYLQASPLADRILRLPANGSLRVGTFDVVVPVEWGSYSVDATGKSGAIGSTLMYGFGGPGDPLTEVSAHNGGLRGDPFFLGRFEPDCLCEGEPCGDPTETTCDHADTCDGLGTCQPNWEPDETPCSDGSVCTLGDSCQSGVCVPGDPIACMADGNQCTDDYCDPLLGCVHPWKPNGTCCDDGNSATGCDKCTNGVCAGKKGLSCPPCGGGGE